MPIRPEKARLQVSLREALNWIIRDSFEPDPSSEPLAPATGGVVAADAGGAFSNSLDEAAKEQLMESLYDGEIVATGRMTAPVQLLDERARREIPARFWGSATVNWDESSASGGGEAYDNIALSRNGVTALWSHGEVDSAEGSTDPIADTVRCGPDADSGYTAPYLKLMRRAIEHFERPLHTKQRRSRRAPTGSGSNPIGPKAPGKLYKRQQAAGEKHRPVTIAAKRKHD